MNSSSIDLSRTPHTGNSPTPHPEEAQVNTNEEFDPQTETPLASSSLFSNQGATTEDMANAEQTRVQGATEEFGLQSGAAAEVGTEEEFDVQDQFDQGEHTEGGQTSITKARGETNLPGASSSKDGVQKGSRGGSSSKGGAQKGSGIRSSSKGGAQRGSVIKGSGAGGSGAGGGGAGGGGTRGGGTREGNVEEKAGQGLQKGMAVKGGMGTLAQAEPQHAGGVGGKGAPSSKGATVVQQKGSVLGDMAYSVVKDVGDAVYGAACGQMSAAKTAYVDANGAPAIFPPTDTFNVYVADCEVETLNNSVQWTSINAQVAAINGLSQEQETQENNSINNTLNAIAANEAAEAAGKKAQTINQIVEGVSIGVACAMIICSVACYATGAGAEAGVELDEVGGEMIADDVVEGGAEGGGLGIGNAAEGDEATDDAAAAADKKAASAASKSATTDSTTKVTTKGATTATTESTTEEEAAEEATTKAASGSMTTTQLASWQLMGVSSLLMAIPQVGNAAINDLTKALEADGLSSEDASWVSMAIITFAMIAAGGLVEGAGSLFTSSTKVAESAAIDSTSVAADAASTTEKETTALTFSEYLTSLSKGASSARDASYQAAKDMMIGIGKLAWGAGKAALKFGEDSLNAIYEAGAELLTNPAAAVWTMMKVTFRMVTKIGEGVGAGFYKLGPDLSAFSEAATASTWKGTSAAIAKGIGSCLPAVMAIGQSVDTALNIYQSTLGLKMAEIEQTFAQDNEAAQTDQAYATSTENIINACYQSMNEMISAANSMLVDTEQTLGDDQQTIVG